MLADFLTMHEHAGKPYDALSYAFLGDCRNNTARSLLVTGALLGSDARLVGPRELWPPGDVVATANELADRSGAHVMVTEDIETGVASVDFVYTDVWVSMGEPREVWEQRVTLLRPYQVNADLMKATGNPTAKFLHCLPAFHAPNTTVGTEIMNAVSMPDGLEVTDEVFESPASIVFDQAENRLHTIKAILVATLG
jgi:ornithine carbamoyltransferase